MTIRRIFPLCLLFVTFAAVAQENSGRDDKSQLPPSYVPSGKALFKQYCASCHGADAKGRGPATPTLNTHVPDLTTLAKRHDGKFPYDYVESTLLLAPVRRRTAPRKCPSGVPFSSTWRITTKPRCASALKTSATTSNRSSRNSHALNCSIPKQLRYFI